MTPAHVSLKRVAPVHKSDSEVFREEATQKLALKNGQNLNVKWRFREGCCQLARALRRGVEDSQLSYGDREWLSMAVNGQTEYGKSKSVTPFQK